MVKRLQNIHRKSVDYLVPIGIGSYIYMNYVDLKTFNKAVIYFSAKNLGFYVLALFAYLSILTSRVSLSLMMSAASSKVMSVASSPLSLISTSST